jgi:hypothetical protein
VGRDSISISYIYLTELKAFIINPWGVINLSKSVMINNYYNLISFKWQMINLKYDWDGAEGEN